MVALLYCLLTALLASCTVLSPVAAGSKAHHSTSCEYLRDATKRGEVLPIKTDTDVLWLTPDHSACGTDLSYRNTSNVACVHPGWLQDSTLGQEKGCFRWIELTNPANGNTAHAQVTDQCGGDPTIKFTCHSVYVSVQVFKQLAGVNADKALNDGRIGNDLEWRFIKTPCWACKGGSPPGHLPNGENDNCLGHDLDGFQRCGRMTGNQRVVGPAVSKYCNKEYSCPKPKTLR
ncbi:hypothetical protein CBS101457_002902 [Exobasidium rhododendri]|nr:hypothetical protein CBS101457_002902 [Exobasidium rhododendri]